MKQYWPWDGNCWRWIMYAWRFFIPFSRHGSLNYVLLYTFTLTFSLVHVCHIKIKMFGYNRMPLEGLSRSFPSPSSIISFSLCTQHSQRLLLHWHTLLLWPECPLHLLVPVTPPCQLISLCFPQGLSSLWSQGSCGPPGQWLSSICNRRLPSDSSSPEQAPFSPRGKQEESLQDNIMSHHN